MRLLSLRLSTSRLAALRAFYADRLGFVLEAQSARHFALRIGQTRLEFAQAPDESNPFYHFAFNIPSASVEAADWLRSHAPLLPAEGADIVAFPNWAAHSVYARDPAGNIIEFIARHELPLPPASQPFSAHDVRCVSEIGLVVADVPGFAAALRERYGLPFFHRQPPAPRFTVLGDDEGLLITVPPGRPWYPTTDELSAVFPLEITLTVTGQADPVRLQVG